MKAFLVLALLVVALAHAKKGGKGKKAKELSEEDAFACMDQTALGDKFMDAMNNCMDLTTTGGSESTGDGFTSTGTAAGRFGFTSTGTAAGGNGFTSTGTAAGGTGFTSTGTAAGGNGFTSTGTAAGWNGFTSTGTAAGGNGFTGTGAAAGGIGFTSTGTAAGGNGFTSTGTAAGGTGFTSTGTAAARKGGYAAGRKGGKNKCKKYDDMLEKYIPEAETRACMLSNMGWIGNAYEPIMSVIKTDIASLDETITKQFNPKTVKKCMKKVLKKATKCSNDVDEEMLTAVVFSYCSDRQFAKGCSKFIKKNMTQAGK